jgi:hypothetical protein
MKIKCVHMQKTNLFWPKFLLIFFLKLVVNQGLASNKRKFVQKICCHFVLVISWQTLDRF